MAPPSIGLSPASFAVAFPFYIAFDGEFTIAAIGPSLARICPSVRPGARASGRLRLKQPMVDFELAAVRRSLGSVFSLEVIVESVVLRGQMLVQEGEGGRPVILFLGSPMISSVTSLAEQGISIDDFALHDAAAELLALLRVQEMTLADAKRLTVDLNRQSGELRSANQRLSAQFAVTRILTEAVDVESAMRDVTAQIGEALGFDVGAWWEVERKAQVLRCVDVWNPLYPRFADLEAAVRGAPIGSGGGIVSQSWTRGVPLFGTEVTTPGRMTERAAKDGLRSVLVFPIQGSHEVLGVMAFLRGAPLPEDGDLRYLVQDTGVKVGQFIERRRAEEALRESEERYALAARGAKDGLWDWELSTGHVYFSARWQGMLGFEEGALRGSLDEWFGRVHPEDRERFEAELSAHVEGRTPHVEVEHRMAHTSGEHRWMLCRGIAVRDAEGNAHRMAGTQTDITERKLAELELVRAREDLARQLAVVERQEQAIRRLSTPIIRVWEGVLAVPVIGALDRARAEQMADSLLGELVRSRAKVAVLDFTGADRADAETTGHLLRVMRAVRLLGSECVIAGVSPVLAQSLVEEGADLSEMAFFRDVKSALADVFRRLGGRAPRRVRG